MLTPPTVLCLPCLSDQELLDRLAPALARLGPDVEVEAYPSPTGVLVFLHPRVPESPSGCHFFVTFA